MSGIFGHRQIMKPAVGAPYPYSFVHLWRFVDWSGSTAPDSGTVGGVDLTLSGAAAFVAEGLDIQGANGSADNLDAALSIDLNDEAEKYSFICSVSMRTAGQASGDNGRLFSIQNAGTGHALQVYSKANPLAFRRRSTSCGTSVEDLVHSQTYPFSCDYSKVRGGGVSIDGTGYFAVQSGVTLTSFLAAGNGGSTTCSAGNPRVVFGNNQEKDRGFDGIIHWAGFSTSILTEAQLQEISLLGRPP